MVEVPKHQKTRSRQDCTLNFLQQTIDNDDFAQRKHTNILANKKIHPKRVKSNPPKFPRSFQYNTKLTQALLQPGKNLGISKDIQYTSQTKNEFRGYDQYMPSHLKDLQNKADVTATRRMLEICNEESINQGRMTQTLDVEKNRKVGKYLKSKYTQELESELTPWRFSPTGWKYQEKGKQNKYLNHENKINILGSTFIRTQTLNSNSPLNLTNTFNSQDYRNTKQDTIDQLNNMYSTSYSQTFYNKAAPSLKMNSPLASQEVKNMERLKDYNYPPIPTIQLAKFAQMKMNQEKSIFKTNRTELSRNELTPSPTKQRSFSITKGTPIKQNTLNGLQSTLKEFSSDDYKIWGGVRVKLDSPSFGKTRDTVTDWQAAFYNGQYFKMIPK